MSRRHSSLHILYKTGTCASPYFTVLLRFEFFMVHSISLSLPQRAGHSLVFARGINIYDIKARSHAKQTEQCAQFAYFAERPFNLRRAHVLS